MKTILVIGAGKSSTCLIDYLVKTCGELHWKLIVADGNLALAQSKTGNSPHAMAASLNVENHVERNLLISQADIVISLLPATLHFIVAKECVLLSKNLLTASYVDDNIRQLAADIKNKGLLFLCEMGLDPGIDHMSAMQIIHSIRAREGIITSFKSHCGGLIAPESDDNPWHYKISWNPRNVVLAGRSGAVFKENDAVVTKSYDDLFLKNEEIDIPGAGMFAFYPNRDSLSYIPVYSLEDASTFIRTTLRDINFCKGWQVLVKTRLTDDASPVYPQNLTFQKWSAPVIPFLNAENKEQLEFLGLFEDSPVPASAKTSADILQYLVETRLVMKPHDRDMILMLHELEYIINGKKSVVKSSLVVKGEDSLRTAMAKTVGLPLGIAARLILQGKIRFTGLHIPVVPEVYEPVLEELALNGIVFNETEES